MSGALQRWIRRAWRGEAGGIGRGVLLLLTPLSWLWRLGSVLKDRRWVRSGGRVVPGIRVISVGNLAVGGTGKTPVARWVTEVLAECGADPAVVSRGYGRDEVLLHRRWNPEVPVVTDPDRVSAVVRAREEGARVAVLDDGFQHRRLARALDLVLVAAEDPLEAPLLPRGPFREPLSALDRAHVVVVMRRTASTEVQRRYAEELARRFPHLVVARATLVPGIWQTLAGGVAPAPTGDVLVATAVARPDTVGALVAEHTGRAPEVVAFADHHDFTETDARALRRRTGDRTLVTTEKDAVKLMAFAELLPPSRVLTLDLEWDEEEASLRALLTRPTPETPS